MFHTQDQNGRRALETPLLTLEDIASSPRFLEIEVRIARHLVSIHEKSPRLARLKASHQKWFLTQMLFALQLERDESEAQSGLTPSRLYEAVARYGIASRNTAASLLSEMQVYRFLRKIPNLQDRRMHVYETTEIADTAMLSWFNGHMACLDELDGGNRLALSESTSQFFAMSQPRAARALMDDPSWRELPETIGSFIWSESGGMILHELVSRLTVECFEAERVYIGEVGIAELARKYTISVTNLKRMFNPTEDNGHAGWEKPRRKGRLWFSRGFMDDYFAWQATKFAALDEAVHWAAERLDASGKLGSGVTPVADCNPRMATSA